MKTIKQKIAKLQEEMKFMSSELEYLDNNNIEYLVVNHDKYFHVIIEVEDISLVKKFVENFPPCEDLKNNIESAGGESWENISPFLLKCEPYNTKYSHLNHYIKLDYWVKSNFKLILELNINIVPKLEMRSEVTPETAHFKSERNREYNNVITLNTNMANVRFYGDAYYYYAKDLTQENEILELLKLKGD